MKTTTCPDCAATIDGTSARAYAHERIVRDPEWVHRAEHWIHNQTTGHQFTADTIVSELGKPHGSPNQIGALLRGWAQRNLIRGTGYTEATRKESHARIVKVWERTA